jgi:iron complex outermembrane recepter protein
MKNVFAVFFVCAASFSSYAQGKLTVKVVSNNLAPIDFALVKIPEMNLSEFTSSSGLISFNQVPKREISIEVVAFGYQSRVEKLDLRENNVLNQYITIKLEVKYNLIQAVQIEATRAKEKSGVAFQNLNAKTIKDNNVGTDVPQLLNNLTSVVSTTDNGTGVGYSYLRIRGTDAQRTNITINGVPFNDAESQGVYFVNMPDLLSSVNSIQIQRGVGSANNGSSAFGASINMQTDGLADSAYAEVALGGGSYQFNKQTLKLGTGLINNKIAADLRLSHIGTKGYINNSVSELTSYFATLGYYGKYSNIKFITFAGKEKTGLSYNGAPEALLSGDKSKLNAFYANNSFSYPSVADSLNLFNGNRKYNSILYKNENDNYHQSHYQLHYAYQKDKWNANISGHYTKGKGYFEQYKYGQTFKKYGLPNAISQVDSSIIKQSDVIRQKHLDNDFSGFIASLTYKAKETLTFTLGTSYNIYTGRHFGKVLWSKTATTIQNFPLDYYNNNAKKTEVGSYIKVNYGPIKKLTVGAELQVRQVNYIMNGLADEQGVTNPSVTKPFKPFINPRISLNYDILYNLSVYGFFGRASKEPNRDDFKAAPTNTLPQVEVLNDFEGGVRFTSDYINANLNYYNMQYQNQLVLTGLLNDVGDQYRTNVSKSYRQGVEIELYSKLNKQLILSANTTISENKILNYTDVVPNYAGNDVFLIKQVYSNTPISYSPNLIANINAQYTPIKAFAIMLNVKHVGQQFLDNTGSSEKAIKPYTVGDLRVSYTYNKGWMKKAHFYVQINNVFNTKYVSNGYSVNYYLGGPQKYSDNYFLVQAPAHFILGTTLTF